MEQLVAKGAIGPWLKEPNPAFIGSRWAVSVLVAVLVPGTIDIIAAARARAGRILSTPRIFGSMLY